MKIINSIFLASCFFAGTFLVSCVNSATNFAMRSNVYQVVPEQLGERASVAGSPTSNDAVVNADKTTETSTKANLGQAVTDSSSTDQHRSAAEKPAEKPAEKNTEADKK